MTLLFTEGFDHEKSNTLGGLFNPVTGARGMVAGRFGGQALSISPNPTNFISGGNLFGFSPYVGCAVGNGAGHSVVIGFAWQNIRSTNVSSTDLIPGIVFMDGITGQFTVALQPSGFVCVNSGENYGTVGTLGISQSALYTVGQWNYCEIAATTDKVSGSVTVRINGANAVSFANKKTSWSVSDLITTIGFVNWADSTGNAGSILIDDMYCCDMQGLAPYNSFLGMCHIQTLFPTGAGSYSGFTPNNPTNLAWQSVNEQAMDLDNSYNTASTIGTKDTFVSTTAFTNKDTILAVTPKMAVKKDDTTSRQLQTYLKSGNLEHGGAAYELPGAYAYALDSYGLNPMTNAPWTFSDVNTLEFGYNIVK